MLKVLMSCFLSFAVLGGTSVSDASIATCSSDFDISNINYDSVEIGMTKVGIGIGRHEMLQITGCDNLGTIPIQTITNWYNGSVLENFSFTDSCTSVTTTTISHTSSVSVSLQSTVQSKLNLDLVSVDEGSSLSIVYTIENTQTYTYSETTSFTISYEIKNEYISGKIFALGMVAQTYKITWDTWQWDDYWWGDYEVSGSRTTYTSYVTIDPYTTIIYQDGSFIA